MVEAKPIQCRNINEFLEKASKREDIQRELEAQALGSVGESAFDETELRRREAWSLLANQVVGSEHIPDNRF